jgi:TonB family protein
MVTVGVLALAGSLQSAPTSFARTRAALAQKFVAALPAAFAPETIPVTSAKPTSAPAGTQGTTAKPKQEVLKLNSVVVSAPNGGEFQNPAPRYPAVLRAAEIEGAVVARFNYDDRGNVDANSIAILTTTNGRFSDVVIDALKGWHGAPKTSAQVPFVFVLANKTGKDLGGYPGGLPSGSVVVSAAPMTEAELAQTGTVTTGDPTRPATTNDTYFEFQVEQPVSAVPGNRGPRYPDELRNAGVEGEVLAQFIVDTEGRADMRSFKVLKSNHDLFTAAVMSTLPDMKFHAAQVGGRTVKQLVQMPFQFNLAKP